MTRKWYEVDYSWHLPEDTVYRPTEQTAFDNLDFLARLIRATGCCYEFNDAEWRVYLKDIELHRRWRNVQIISPQMISAELGLSAEQVVSIRSRIERVLIVREQLMLPAVPPMPARYRADYKRIVSKAA